jgi:hypothetical protein
VDDGVGGVAFWDFAFVKPYQPRSDREARKSSAVALAKGVVSVAGDVRPARLNKALGEAIWEYTEADGKYGCRYRSAGALAAGDASEFQHEHVVPRQTLIAQMLAQPDRVEDILRTAVGCIVTRAEHAVLNRVDRGLEGWSRYVAAGVRVWDAEQDAWLFDLPD